jgi:hypothetical protein
MASSHFLSLPTELRFQVYAYLFAGERICLGGEGDRSHDASHKTMTTTSIPKLSSDGDEESTCHKPTTTSSNTYLPPLLFSSRLIALEARPIYFSALTLHCALQGRSPNPHLSSYLQAIGEESTRLLCHFTFHWDNYIEISLDLLTTPLPKEDEQSAAETTVYASKCVMPAMGFGVCEDGEKGCEACKICPSSSFAAGVGDCDGYGVGGRVDGGVDATPSIVDISSLPSDEEPCHQQSRPSSPTSTSFQSNTSELSSFGNIEKIPQETQASPKPTPPSTSSTSSLSHLQPQYHTLLPSPPKSIRISPRHCITVSALSSNSPTTNTNSALNNHNILPSTTTNHHDLWRAMDTPAFCDALSAALSASVEVNFPQLSSTMTIDTIPSLTTTSPAPLLTKTPAAPIYPTTPTPTDKTRREMIPTSPPSLSPAEILLLVRKIGKHASGLKWMWF